MPSNTLKLGYPLHCVVRELFSFTSDATLLSVELHTVTAFQVWIPAWMPDHPSILFSTTRSLSEVLHRDLHRLP